jgi:5'-3' exonuclease
MGVEKFFSSVKKPFFKKYFKHNQQFIRDFKDKLKCNYLLIDFNSIVHITSQYMLQGNKNDFDKNDFEQNLIENVLKYILNLLHNYIETNNIKGIDICVDGVPTMSKIYEQKKRRYMGDLLHNITLVKKENKFTWSKNNISPGTDFMRNMIDGLKSKEFETSIKKICKNIIYYNVSGVDINGEGEFKIVNIIKNLKKSSDIVVYSPDSDMILLLLLSLSNHKIVMLRYDQQNTSYNTININEFHNILMKYIEYRIVQVNKSINIELDKIIIINDIVFILSIFGDDFIAKLETVRVNLDINIILDLYVMNIIKNGYIMTFSNNKYIINTNNFLSFLKSIQHLEIFFIDRNRKHHIYSNYHKIEDEIIGNILYKLRDIIINYIWKFIYLNKPSNISVSPINVNKYIEINKFIRFINNKEPNIDTNLLAKFMKKNINNTDDCFTKMEEIFLSNYIEILQNINIDNYLILKPIELLKEILLYFYKYYSLPFNNTIKLSKVKLNYNTFSSTDPIHEKRLKRYAKEDQYNYKIDNKLDNYFKMFNPLDDFYNNTKKSDLETYNLYYKIHFNNINIKDLVNDYITGLNWVLNYYHNNIIDWTWYYRYNRSPLLREIIMYFNPKLFTLNNYKVIEPWFTPLEHFVFVTPFDINNIKSHLNIDNFTMIQYNKNNINNIINFISNNKHFFYNLTQIYKTLLNNKLVDCSSSFFLSKCHLLFLENKIDINEYIISIRKYLKLT